MKYWDILRCLVFLVVFYISVSCQRMQNLSNAEKIVDEWVGKEIIFPSDIRCTYMGRDTICSDVTTPYKILVYTDSAGCTSCKLQLYKWNSLIEDSNILMSDQVSFLFYFQPKNEKELQFLLRKNDFEHTVFIDNSNELSVINKLPNDTKYQCFLLDKDDKVVLVGNPAINLKIWNLYKQAILGKVNQDNISVTTVEVEQTEIELQEELKVYETTTGIFVLKNNGSVPLLIKDIITSCGCTVPEWNKQLINPKDKTEIRLKVTPDALGYFKKTAIVYCNTEKGYIWLSVEGVVKD